jgi:hypothetical protein
MHACPAASARLCLGMGLAWWHQAKGAQLLLDHSSQAR